MTPPDTTQPIPPEEFITVPAQARAELGELTYFLEQALQNLREVRQHVHDSRQHVPGILHDLREIVSMTESATVKVLEETEALVDEGRVAAKLLAELRSAAAGDGPVSTALGDVAALVARSNERAIEIMTALEFQDITSQKVQRAFIVLEEVLSRLEFIRALVEPRGGDGASSMPPAAAPEAAPVAEEKSGQALVDELLLDFKE